MADDVKQRLRELSENLALTMAEGGMQRSTARVLAALLFSDQETMTAADLCAELGISSGAVSGAVRQLGPAGLIERAPAPGSRRDHFRVPRGAWATLMGNQNTVLGVLLKTAEEGVEAAGEDSFAGRRLAEMRDFYAYMDQEMPRLIERWRERYFGRSG